MTCCYIGIGSNIDNPIKQLQRAFDWLQQLPSSHLVKRSALFRTAPIGPQDQPDFINAVAALETTLTPLVLLDQLQHLEQKAGRIHRRHWGERSLDLDLLLYGKQTINTPRLKVPHPEMQHRAFVLVPLADIEPGLQLPCGQLLSSLLHAIDQHGVEKLSHSQIHRIN